MSVCEQELSFVDGILSNLGTRIKDIVKEKQSQWSDGIDVSFAKAKNEIMKKVKEIMAHLLPQKSVDAAEVQKEENGTEVARDKGKKERKKKEKEGMAPLLSHKSVSTVKVHKENKDIEMTSPKAEKELEKNVQEKNLLSQEPMDTAEAQEEKVKLFAELGYFTDVNDDKIRNTILKYRELKGILFDAADRLSHFLESCNPRHQELDHFKKGFGIDYYSAILLTEALQASYNKAKAKMKEHMETVFDDLKEADRNRLLKELNLKMQDSKVKNMCINEICVLFDVNENESKKREITEKVIAIRKFYAHSVVKIEEADFKEYIEKAFTSLLEGKVSATKEDVLILQSAKEAADVIYSMISVTPPLLMQSDPPTLNPEKEYNPLLHQINKSMKPSQPVKVFAYSSPIIYINYEGSVAEQGTVITT